MANTEAEFLSAIEEMNRAARSIKATASNWNVYRPSPQQTVTIHADSVSFEGGAAVFRLNGEVRQAFAPGGYLYILNI